MSYFRKNIDAAEGYTPGFQPKSQNILKLNTNENPYPPSPKAMEALRAITPEQLRRYPDPAGDSFRAEAAKVNNVTADCIMCSNGGDDLLTIAIRAFCDENRPLAYPTLTYSLYPVLAKLQNCPVVEVPFDEDFGIPEKLIETQAALTILCNPNAPTGTFIEPDEISKLADKLSGVLMVDEAYVDFAEENCAALVKKHNNIMILRSMSKGYSLAGLRFGYCIACPEIISGLLKVKDSYNVDAVSIAIATAAISDQNYLKEIVNNVKEQRALLTAALRKMGFSVKDSSANFVLASYKNEAKSIYNKLIEKNIFVRHWDNPGLSDKLRITVGTEEQNQMLIDALEIIL